MKSEIIRYEKDYDFDESAEYISTLTKNAEVLLKYIDNVLLKTLERKHSLIKNRGLVTDFEKTVNLTNEKFRLPLYSKNKIVRFSDNPEFVRRFLTEDEIAYYTAQNLDPQIKLKADNFVNFKKRFFEILTVELDKNQISQIFFNSFKFEDNPEYPEILNIEFTNSTSIHHCFYQIFKTYNNFQSKLVSDIRETQKVVSDKIRARVLLEKKIKQINTATKVDFMWIMFYSFPQIRDTFELYKLINPNVSLDAYLTTKSRNIR